MRKTNHLHLSSLDRQYSYGHRWSLQYLIQGRTDFNLYGNTNYSYTISFKHQGLPVDDRRVTIIDPILASQSNSNLVPTANCFMIAPGGAFCFDPFKYQINGNDNNVNTTLKGWAGDEGGIASVKVIWQTKENGDLGDPVLGIVNSNDE